MLEGHCHVCRAKASRTVHWCDRHGDPDTIAGRDAEERRRLRLVAGRALGWLLEDQRREPNDMREVLIGELSEALRILVKRRSDEVRP